MSDLIELGEPDVIRNEDNILWLRTEIEELRSYLDEEREKNEKQVRMTMDAHAEIERLKADRDTWEATCQTVDKKLQRAKAEIEQLRTFKHANLKALQEAQRQIERLEAALAKSCEEGRAEMYDCGFNGLKAEIDRLADLAFAYRNASFSDQEDIGLELDAALEGDDE